MGNEIQPSVPIDQSLSQTPAFTPPSTNWSRILLFVVLGLAVAAGLVFVGIQIGKNQTPSQPPIIAQPSALPTQIAINPTTNWETYSSASAGFSIEYPSGWRKGEAEKWVGFGPQEIEEDVVWGVSFYNKSEKTITQIKDELGKQFPDRKQTEETISFNGLSATKVITTTNQFADWYLVTIIIDNINMLYEIGNGAQTDKALNEMITKRTGKSSSISFENFYSSFKITK